MHDRLPIVQGLIEKASFREVRLKKRYKLMSDISSKWYAMSDNLGEQREFSLFDGPISVGNECDIRIEGGPLVGEKKIPAWLDISAHLSSWSDYNLLFRINHSIVYHRSLKLTPGSPISKYSVGSSHFQITDSYGSEISSLEELGRISKLTDYAFDELQRRSLSS